MEKSKNRCVTSSETAGEKGNEDPQIPHILDDWTVKVAQFKDFTFV